MDNNLVESLHKHPMGKWIFNQFSEPLKTKFDRATTYDFIVLLRSSFINNISDWLIFLTTIYDWKENWYTNNAIMVLNKISPLVLEWNSIWLPAVANSE